MSLRELTIEEMFLVPAAKARAMEATVPAPAVTARTEMAAAAAAVAMAAAAAIRSEGLGWKDYPALPIRPKRRPFKGSDCLDLDFWVHWASYKDLRHLTQQQTLVAPQRMEQ